MKPFLQLESTFVLLAFTLLGSTLPGCAKSSQDLFVPGKATVGEIKAQLGEPERTTVPNVRPQAKLMDYPDGTSFQIEKNVMIGVSFPPTEEQLTLQYWRHKWEGHPQRFEEIPGSRNVHGQKSYQLFSLKENQAVIYEEQSDRITRVVKYETR
ncbi:hypothetical protein WDW37_12485 [Bdellovibrionota bacterium FG-1]